MEPHEIKKARLERGWTQSELARRVGSAQSTISMIERGTRDSALLRARIERLFSRDDRPSSGSPPVHFALPDLASPPLPPRLPISISSWQRPEYAADFVSVHPLPEEALLVVAIDVSGHGVSALPSRLFLEGWLRGWMEGQKSPPRLESLVREMSSELRRTGIEAAGFFALISRQWKLPHTVTYEALACGFPAPLLITGLAHRTPASAGDGPPLPIEDGQLSTLRDEISAPWRLVIATDGLLARLGDRDEREGLRKLREWQTGRWCDLPPESYLATESGVGDDELLCLLQWSGWDFNLGFEVGNHEERHRALSMIDQFTSALEPRRRDGFLQAVLEAFANVDRHAYPGTGGLLHCRFREQVDGFCVEVEDEGIDNVSRSKVHKPESGFTVMRDGTDALSVRRGAGGGTTVTLFARKPKESQLVF